MSLFDRFRGQPAPPWASFFSRGEFERFRGVVAADFAARGWRFIEDGDGLIVNPDDPEKRREYGLVNLAQQCHQADRDEWPAIVAGHFDGLVAAFDAEDDMPTTWTEARALVKLRLTSAEVALPDDAVRFPVAPGLQAALALDLPTTIAYLRNDSVDGWPPPAEVYQIALDNMRGEPTPERAVIVVDGAPVTWLTGESFFVASRLLFLDEVVDTTGPHGVLVAVPTRHMLLAHPIRDARVVAAINGLTELATTIHRDGPGSVSPSVLWWRDGTITVVESTFDGRRVRVEPAPALAEVIESLAPGTVT